METTLDLVSLALSGVPQLWKDASPGEQVRALRRARGVSQRQLAEVSGVDQADISRLERGADARLATWKSLFASLGCSAVLLPLFSCEETAEWLERGAQERKDRMDAGRMRRR